MLITKQTPASQNAKRRQNLKAVLALLGILIFIGGAVSVFLISQNQDTTPVAPNVPQSKPAAYIEKTQTCTLVFDVTEPDKLACGAEGCETDSDCSNDLVCITADDGDKYCAKEEYEAACADDPSTTTCCTEPEEELLACGESGCVNSDDCTEGFVCVSTSETDDDGNIVKYCADEDFLDACVANPNATTCCSAPTVTPSTTVTTTTTPTVTTTITTTTTPTVTTTTTPTTTVTPSVTTVITTVGCNDVCDANADCGNISHVCYEGRCRLDVNPTDAQCRLPSGETTIVRPVHVPTESGPADWLNYVKAGLGVLGVGALLLLLL